MPAELAIDAIEIVWHGAIWREYDTSRPPTSQERTRADEPFERLPGRRIPPTVEVLISQTARLYGYQIAASRFGVSLSTAWKITKRLEARQPHLLRPLAADTQAQMQT